MWWRLRCFLGEANDPSPKGFAKLSIESDLFLECLIVESEVSSNMADGISSFCFHSAVKYFRVLVASHLCQGMSCPQSALNSMSKK